MWEPITGNQFSVIYMYIVVDLSTCMPFFILHCVKTTVLNINIFHYTLSKLDQHCGKTMLKYSVYLSNACGVVVYTFTFRGDTNPLEVALRSAFSVVGVTLVNKV